MYSLWGSFIEDVGRDYCCGIFVCLLVEIGGILIGVWIVVCFIYFFGSVVFLCNLIILEEGVIGSGLLVYYV